ncbi:hypothetical protein GDO86_006310 [Hymenochirus boettgeri]|uniref:CEP152 CEP63 binding coiled coil domain-containing protein n=1 Tax=Hymenochirus boettgeri TaxID=247094 RepID=A0A8T2JAA9_9PIPI|nr:hypothetical protein GDO86_006310 [Hymenochirus boettgeri]
MSIDFDSGALQTQQEEEEYDKEDYAREQELQQLLTDLPHDMLDDSLSSSSEPNYSDCSGHELSAQVQPWAHRGSWGEDDEMSNRQHSGHSANPYCIDYVGKQNENLTDQVNGEKMPNGWNAQHADKKEEMINSKYPYQTELAFYNESNGEGFYTGGNYDGPGRCSSSELYHLPDDFQPYTNGHQQTNPDSKRENFQKFTAPEETNHQPGELFQVKYNPYKSNIAWKDEMNKDIERKVGKFDDLQREFLDTGESSSGNMQFIQLQVLYKARGRQLEEQSSKFEECERQIRYLNHQLAIVKDEKAGLAISLQESHTLLQNSRETELQLKGQLTALEKTIESLTTNEEQLRNELKVAKVAMESMQQQVLDLCRSESIQRTREQHEAVVFMLKKKHEEQVLALEQRLDNLNTALHDQKEQCSRLEDQLRVAERKQEESKLDKTDIINRLSKSLEESQKQCANLLQAGSIQEATLLQLQLQQIQSSKIISDDMNKALHEEISELKAQITMYESAARLGVFLHGEEDPLSDSYVDLGIKKTNWHKLRLNRAMQHSMRNDLSEDEMVLELKTELERCLSSNITKRQQVVQLQSDLKDYQTKTEELKKLLEEAQRAARDSQIKAETLENRLDPSLHKPALTDELKEEIQKLQSDKQLLQKDIEKYLLCIKDLTAEKEKLKAANQEICNEMRGMIQDFDRDKKEAIERCERTYEQHHEDIKVHLQKELYEKCEAEKELLSRGYEDKLAQLQLQINEMNNELTAVQECYISVCKEKDTLEDTVRDNLKKEIEQSEGQLRGKLLKEKDESLEILKSELEEKHQSGLLEAKAQWQREKELEFRKQMEAQLVLAKENWSKEHLQMTEKAIQDAEKEWKLKLDQTLLDPKIKSLQSSVARAIQTDETSLSESALHLECKNELKVQLHNALQEKERAVRQVEMELEGRHREGVSKQVELAVAKAHDRWMEELTSLPQYKAQLKLEKENWEKINESVVKKQISEAIEAAEKKWKRISDKVDFTVRQKELEEKIISMKRALELKEEEFQVLLKAETAKARAQWNKEKHDEIHRIQEQNEMDYRAFLDEHRNKLCEVLSTAKGDFEKQKHELITQKDAEMLGRLDQSLKQWSLEESRRVHEREYQILSEVERCMCAIHDQQIDKSTVNDPFPKCSDGPFVEKLRAYLQKSVKGILYKVLTNARQEWKKEYKAVINQEEANSGVEHARSGNPRTAKRDLDVKINALHSQVREDLHPNSCCEPWIQQLDISKKECRDIKGRLDKACRHLQQLVKDQKSKAEKYKESERITEETRKQNTELIEKIAGMEAAISPSSFQPEKSSNSCGICGGNALEEMRAQYIKAVDKIKNDMLRYINESKGRAAEMLKSEVLRERQETARKMRKYYLTCLQQLLKDDGKNEGAEKKIINAASKLATMAKVLETPVSQKYQSKSQSGTPHGQDILSENDQDKCSPMIVAKSNNPVDQKIDQQTIDELIKRHSREKSEGNKVHEASATNLNLAFIPIGKGFSNQRILQDLPTTNSQFVTRMPCQKVQTSGYIDCNTEPDTGKPQEQNEPLFLKVSKGFSSHEHSKKPLDQQKFDLHEAPVRDENGSNDWICGSSKSLLLSHSAQGSLTRSKLQTQISDLGKNSVDAGLCSNAEESHNKFGSDYKGQTYFTHIAKKEIHLGIKSSNKILDLSNKIPEFSPSIAAMCSDPQLQSDAVWGSRIPSRKLLDFTLSPQQDSGFDSPFPNLNSFS